LILALLLLIAGAGAVWAAIPLRATMLAWRADARTLEQMLAGSPPLDKSKATQLLQGFVADSQSLAARAKGSSSAALDIKTRFEAFAADAQLAIEAVRADDKPGRRYARLRADCQSCHDVYAN